MTNAEQMFIEAFDSELQDLTGTASVAPTEWRAGGKRVTKANPDPTGEDEKWWRAHGPGMVQNWMDWRRKTKWAIWKTPSGEPAIEMGLAATIANMPIKMVIDRVMVVPHTNNLCILDLKSGARTPESDFQLAVYRYGLLKVLNVRVNFGTYWMARKGELAEIVNLTRFTPQMIEAWFARLKTGIESEVFIPHVTSMCRACGMREFCAAYGGNMSHMDPDSPNYKLEGK